MLCPCTSPMLGDHPTLPNTLHPNLRDHICFWFPCLRAAELHNHDQMCFPKGRNTHKYRQGLVPTPTQTYTAPFMAHQRNEEQDVTVIPGLSEYVWITCSLKNIVTPTLTVRENLLRPTANKIVRKNMNQCLYQEDVGFDIFSGLFMVFFTTFGKTPWP